MTTTVNDRRAPVGVGNGSATAFPYDFKIAADTELVVVLKETATLEETAQVLATDYTVDGVGNDAGGNVNFITAPASGFTVYITGQTTADQLTDLPAAGDMFAESTEDALDKLTFLAQELRSSLARVLTLSPATPLTDVQVQVAADKFLQWNEDGTQIIATPSPAFGPTNITELDTAIPVIGDTFQFVDSTDGQLKKADVSNILGEGGDMSTTVYDPGTIEEQVVGLTASQTLTNKTINADNNTISNIGTSELTDNGVTLDKMAHQTQGDLLLYGASGAPAVLNIGASGRVLTSNGTTASWVAPTGDMLAATYDAAGIEEQVVGENSTQTLTNKTISGSSNTLSGIDYTSLANETAGDILYFGSGGTPAKLAAGTNGQVLTLASGLPSWENASGVGDMLVSTYDPAGIGQQVVGTTAAQTVSGKTFDTVAGVTMAGGSRRIGTGTTASDALTLGAYDTDGLSYTTLATLTAGTTPTMDLSVAVTMGGNALYYASGTDIPITDGGTGASNAADARSNLGLEIGTDVQAHDGGLTSIAALDATDGNIIVGNGTTWVAESGGTARTSLGVGSSDAVTFGTVTLAASGYMDIPEIATPSNPSSNTGRLYVKDDTSTTKLYFRDSAGVETSILDLGGGGGGSLDNVVEDTTPQLGGDLDTNGNHIRMSNSTDITTGTTASDDFRLRAYDVDGGVYQTFITLEAGNTPTCNLDTSVTMGGGTIYRENGTDVPVADGGTGASTQAGARSNLGLEIGSDVQAHDAGLTAIASLAVTDGNIIVGNGSTWVAESGATARTSLGLGSLATASTVNNDNWSGTDLAVTNGGTGASDVSTARTNLGLAIGSDVQAYDAGLADIAALAVTDGNIIVGDGANWVAESGVTARASLGLSIGTDVQEFSAKLLSIAASDVDDGNFIVGNGTTFTVESGATARASMGALAATDTSIGKHTVWIPASAMLTATTNGAASGSIETTTNAINVSTLDFDASTDEYAHFNIAFPKSWNEGTVTFQALWTSTATDTDGVAWGLQGVSISDNVALDTAWGTAVVVTDDAQSAAEEIYITSESSAVTIAGTPAEGDVCFFRIFRDVSDANDDMTEDAQLVGIRLFYTTNAGEDT